MISNLLLAVFSAVLSGLSIPNELFLYGCWPLGFISLCPLYIALCRAKSPGQAAVAMGTFGALQHAITSYWLFFYKDFALWTIGATTVAYFFVYELVGLYASFLLRSDARAFRPFIFALFWVCFEYLKSTGFLGYPWGLIPYSMTSIPVMLQIADVTGVYGVSFVLALSSAAAGELAMKANPSVPLNVADGPFAAAGRSIAVGTAAAETRAGDRRLAAGGPAGRPADRRSSDGRGRGASGVTGALDPSLMNTFVFCACLVLLTLGYGLYSEGKTYSTKGSVRMLLVQQNTDPWIAGEKAAIASNLTQADRTLEANRAQGGAPIDMTVFSETSLRRPYKDFKPWYWENPKEKPLIPYILSSDAPLLTGAPVVLDWDTESMTNSVILLSKEGDLVDSYAKMHPVPFAEAIPFWEYGWFRTFMQQVVGLDSGWTMGSKFTRFTVPLHATPGTSVTFSTPICFEDAFSDLCRRYILLGADLLVNLTNDSWSRTKSAQIQHWAIARIRAIENRRTLVRSTNSGVTCVVGPHGEVLFEMPQFQPYSAIVDVPVFYSDAMTIYTTYGDWFSWLCLIGVAILAVRDFVRARGRWPAETLSAPLNGIVDG